MMIQHSRYTGEAALVAEGSYATLAHQGPRDLFTNTKEYTIDGVVYAAISSAPSKYVPAVTLVRLVRV